MIAFLYAGQGSQVPGMGLDFYEDPACRGAFDALAELKPIVFEGPAEALNDTAVAQPALAAFAMAVTTALAAEGLVPAVTAGLSLGQYSALAAAGAMDTETLIRLTAARGKAMAEAAAAHPGGMMAVLGMDAAALREALAPLQAQGLAVWLANDNMPGQQVIAGSHASLAVAKDALAGQARRVLPLKTSGAFHTPLMAPAAAALALALDAATLRAPALPVYSNVSAAPLAADPALIAADLLAQLTAPVRFREMLLAMQAAGVTHYIEIGPGHVLRDLVRRTLGKDVFAYSIEKREDVSDVLHSLGGLL